VRKVVLGLLVGWFLADGVKHVWPHVVYPLGFVLLAGVGHHWHWQL
jgi:hypothetical protein